MKTLNTYSKGQIVNVEILGELVKGEIVRKQGGNGYMVNYLDTTTSQDFTSGKLTTHTIIRKRYFKTEKISNR